MFKIPTHRYLSVKTVWLWVAFISILGCGTYGTSALPEGTGAPESPVLVTATPDKSAPGTIELNWVNQPTTGTNYNYNIYESTNPNVSPSSYKVKLTNVGLPPALVSNLTSGTTYYFVVTTVDSFTNLESLPSSPAVSATAP